MNKVIFIDLDDTLTVDKDPTKKEPHVFTKGAVSFLQRVINEGYDICIVTNQSGIAKGISHPMDVLVYISRVIGEIEIICEAEEKDIKVGLLLCPHQESDNCDCRKPKVKHVLEYIENYNYDLKSSYFIGNSITDSQAGLAAGLNVIPFQVDWATVYSQMQFSAINVHEHSVINGVAGGLAIPKRVDKWWGYELHYSNDERYCMKLLHFEKDGHTSMHYHVGKHETLLVTSGILKLEILFDKKKEVYTLTPGQAWVIQPGLAHRLVAVDGPLDVVESSTIDHVDDSVRIH